jgi:hypothetical protein
MNDPSRYLKFLREETAREYQPCPEMEEALVYPRLLITGPAGAGKTAFLRYVAYLWCRALEDARTYTLLFPVFLRMAELAAHIEGAGGGPPRESPEWLADFLGRRGGQLGWQLSPEFLRQKIAAGFLLLDGLQEAPEWAARLVENVAAAFPRSRLVVTTREGGPALPGFHICRARGNAAV